MATKSALITALNGFISAVVNTTKHRNANNTIVDEIYPTQVTDNSTSQTYTTVFNSNIAYELRITKSGNIAHIRGQLQNTTTSILASQNAFTWKDSEFRPRSGNDFRFQAVSPNGQNRITLFLSNNVLAVISNFPPESAGSEFYAFEYTTYLTND
jgi:hypothetical protein